MTSSIQHYIGDLERTPFPNRPTLAQARMMPLFNEHDFTVMADLPANETRVLLSFSDYFEMLAGLVDVALNSNLDLEQILVSVSMPSGGRLPKPLLNDRVFMLQDITDEEARLVKSDKRFLVIDDHICRFRLQTGDNSIHLRMHNIKDPDAFRPLKEYLSSVGVKSR
ncbi:hypothetical protein [Pleionea sediminis]|uniref:hypothetical protein n=1 Tax=Pleionea sediminis TaxID=2569479 RepID=UPI0011862B69|nr:hypothetical protein [Pleionea sediminis]